jgi:hypothetical protein
MNKLSLAGRSCMDIKKLNTKKNIVLIIIEVIISFLSLIYTGYLLNKYQNQIYSFIGLIILLIGIVVFIYLMELVERKTLFGVCFCCFLLIISGYFILILTKIYTDKQMMIITFYSTLVGALTASGIGLFGAAYGSRIGGKQAHEAAIEAIAAQIKHENEKRENEKKETNIYIRNIIVTFLQKEIKNNYEILDITGVKNLPIGTNFKLRFDEYEKSKYTLLMNPTTIVREINKLYCLFYEILELNENNQIQDKLNKLNEIIEQREAVEDLINDLQYKRKFQE